MRAQRLHPQVACLGIQSAGAGRTPLLHALRRAYHTVPNNPEFSVPQLKMLLRQVEKILGRKISLN
jgi:hypothetical protein